MLRLDERLQINFSRTGQNSWIIANFLAKKDEWPQNDILPKKYVPSPPYKSQLSLSTPSLPLIQARNQKKSETVTGWINYSGGRLFHGGR